MLGFAWCAVVLVFSTVWFVLPLHAIAAINDDDDDGILNSVDACPFTPTVEISQVDSDGCGPSKRDSDSDGVVDSADVFPFDPSEVSDGDLDGVGNNRDECSSTSPGRDVLSNGCAFLPPEKLGVTIAGQAVVDKSGTSVAISGDGHTVAIGAPYSASLLQFRFYSWDGRAWQQLGRSIFREGYADVSGWSVAMSSDGTTVAIGARETGGNGYKSGSISLYHWNGSKWSLSSVINGEAAGDQFGTSVALSNDGTTVAVGAPFNDHNGTDSGHVRLYRSDGSTWQQLGADIAGEAAGDQSGNSVALASDGSTVAVGSWANNGNGAASGHVRLYRWNGSTWQQLGADIDGETAYDESGSSVALSSDGSTVAIGAAHNDGNGPDSGHVRLYRWDGNSWQQLGADIDGEAAYDESGSSVALSSDGTVVAIGATGNDSNGIASGHVRLYRWDGSAWQQLSLDIDGEAALEHFGTSTALSSDGSTVAIGSDCNGDCSGRVSIYGIIQDSDEDGIGDTFDAFPLDPNETLDTDHDGSGNNADIDDDGDGVDDTSDAFPLDAAETGDGDLDGIGDRRDECPYTRVGRVVLPNGCAFIQKIEQMGLDIDGEAAGDELGTSVVLSSDGTTVAVGARYNDGNGTKSGHVRLFRWDGSAWQQLGADIDGEAAYDYSGTAVSLSSDGNIVAIGATGNDGNGTDAGHVRLYRWDGSTWRQLGADIDGEAAYDESGISVALSSDGSTVAIGAWFNRGGYVSDRSNAGHVRLYRWNGGTWQRLGEELSGSFGANSGASVALSSDGTTVAVGARYDDGNGARSGHVRLYRWNGGIWQKLGADIDGEAAGDESGVSVALSGDGSTVAVGAAYNDGTGGNSGHVRLHRWDGNSWQQLGADIDGEAAYDESGISVALSSDGSTLAIGAMYNDGNGSNSGHIRLYRWDGSTWRQLGEDINGEAAGDRSGGSVALSNDGGTLAIGATRNADNGSNSGHVRVYTIIQQDADEDGVGDTFDAFPFNWSETLDTDGDGIGDNADIDDDGDGIDDVIDAFPLDANESMDTDNDGIGDNADTNQDTDGDGVDDIIDAFPLDITESIDTDNDGIGNNTDNDDDGDGAEDFSDAFPLDAEETSDTDSDGIGDRRDECPNTTLNREVLANGCAFVSQLQRLGVDIDGEAAGDRSGGSVALSDDGRVLAIGATVNADNGTDSGHVRLYRWNGGTWQQLGADIDGEAAGDESGVSVVLSSDGSTVAIGAHLNDGNGTDAGHVRLYRWDGSTWRQLGADIDGEAAGDRSGRSIALTSDGSTIAIGATGNDGNGADAGHVRLYRWDGSTWGQLGADIDGEAAGDRSGGSVALASDGSTIAIGATGNDGNGTDAGHVRLYHWDGGIWRQLGADIDGEAAGDRSGGSVALASDGSTIAIGATGNDGNGTDAGHIRLYRWDGSIWHQLGADIEGEAAYDYSGIAVALSADGNTAARGAILNDGYGNDSGHVRLYHWDGSAWKQLGADINGEWAFDWSGASVAISSDSSSVAIGAIYNDGNGTDSGNVRIYKIIQQDSDEDGVSDVFDAFPLDPYEILDADGDGTGDNTDVDDDGDGVDDLSDAFPFDATETSDGDSDGIGDNHDECPNTTPGREVLLNGCAFVPQQQLGADIDGEASVDLSGESVALSSNGTTLAIGAHLNDGNGTDSGNVRLYRWEGGAWQQLGANIGGEAAGDWSGSSVALSGDGGTVAIGAFLNDGNGTDAGHVRLYRWDGSTWRQLGADIDGEAAGDWSGSSVALSGDGSTVAVGARYNDGTGGNSGHVRLYRWDGSTWRQLGTDIDGEAADDYSGIAVSLSSDGGTIAIGATGNDGNGTGAGHVRLYRWDGSIWQQLGADIDGEAAYDRSGVAVSLSSDGSTIAIGSTGNDDNGPDSGHVRLYRWDGSAWKQLGAGIDGEVAGDKSGGSIALTGDGSTIAIGATDNDDNGTDSGHVRLYRWNGSSWQQLGADVEGEAEGDESGGSVALSSDGGTLAIGARANDGNGFLSGHVRVYNIIQQDTDEDGVGDADDPFPLDATESIDTDNDGVGNNTDTDDDGDGVGDTVDPFPLDFAESVDTDGDGIGNNTDTDDDGDGVGDTNDAFPLDATESVDTDNDGIGNNADTDDDGDGIDDSTDDFPLDATESLDIDGDGIGNNSDTDDDGDGVEDTNDAFPQDATEFVDTDNDGIGNNTDTDDDGDGVSDITDPFPLDATESADTDGDGIGNNTDACPLEAVAKSIDKDFLIWSVVAPQIAESISVREGCPGLWQQVGNSITISQAGMSPPLAMSQEGDVVAVGSIRGSPLTVYELTEGTYVQRGDPIPDSELANAYVSALDLSADGSVLVVGAPGARPGNFAGGAVFVFDWNGTNWVRRSVLSDNQIPRFGRSVSVSNDGRRIAVGAPGSSAFDEGRSAVYEWNGMSWRQLGSTIVGERPEDYAGYSVSLAGDGQSLAVGAPGNDGGSGSNVENTNKGHVRIYRWTGTTWSQRGLDIDALPTPDSFDAAPAGLNFGHSVALSADGLTVAIGSAQQAPPEAQATALDPFADPAVPIDQFVPAFGSPVRVFDWTGSQWEQRSLDGIPRTTPQYTGGPSSPTGPDADISDLVAISDDGLLVAVGQGGLVGSEPVRVFRWNQEAAIPQWEQWGNAIGDDIAAGGNTGGAIALSGDGTRLIVGPFPATSSSDVTLTTYRLVPRLTDTDNDGIPDKDDAFPEDVTESVDTDSDGIGDNADAFPNDGSETADTDGDGVGDNSDAFPRDSSETIDTDGDGLGDNLEQTLGTKLDVADSDADGFTDKEEYEAGSNPTDANDEPLAAGLPIWLLHEASKLRAQ